MTKRKLTKSAMARKLLERGYSVADTAKMVGMSYGHSWAVYREMNPKAQSAAPETTPEVEDDNVVRPRVTGPHSMARVTKAEAEVLKAEAYAQATRGRPDDFNSVDTVLAERGEDYGDYASKAQFIQGVKHLMRSSPSWGAMDADMRESMEMIAHKMGRTLYGNPTHKDNFLDIAGYAKLVADRL
jgi:molybdenum-dependent DNA-binding transcriptional regulator ModE